MLNQFRIEGTISRFPAFVVLDEANIGTEMNGSLSYLFEVQENLDTASDLAPANENTGYDPYDNPGTHKEMPDEAA